ncbi:PLP-dependent aminotransferase family protein [Agrococcus jenensis]|uniref:2-aminoadipate transaminase n=1 Tax=Agrococcus jenensis TaxID=46353 RepID=A0A3N2ANP7_9MICO|nr:PLP-dependent aminotransferase family protein [Agrococcus jenensis]ROR64691.1 2-aminoadipate transaminase [Agrococcus jenensis]
MVPDTRTAASRLLEQLPARQGFGDATLIKHRPGSIDLGGGNPDVEALPTALYRDAARDLTEGDAFAASLRYVPAPGIPALRTWIAEREGVDAERVIVTTGGAHGLALAVLGTLDAGDEIVVDDPVYPLFLRTLDLVGAHPVPIRVDAHGIDVDELERRLLAGLRPKALFTVPTFQNPSGGTLPDDRARRLAELADRFGFTIIFDDPYREVGFEPGGVDVRSRQLDSDRVIAVNTFSKTLGPALRVGWIVVPEALAERFVRLRNRLDGLTSGTLQELVLRIVQRQEYPAALAAAGVGYGRKARALQQALESRFGDAIEITEPSGGFFLWARLHGDADFARLHALAQDEGVFFQRGEWFAVDDDAHLRGTMRLSFSEQPTEALVEGVERLHRAWRQLG